MTSNDLVPVKEAVPRFSWPHIVLSVLGFAISFYAFRLHGIIQAGGDSGCGFTETLSCDKVLASQYGSFLGISLGVYGMAYFVMMLLFSITTNPKTSLQQETLLRLLVCLAGLLGTIGLSYISYIILRAACPVCMATHATIITAFIIALWQFLAARRKQTA